MSLLNDDYIKKIKEQQVHLWSIFYCMRDINTLNEVYKLELICKEDYEKTLDYIYNRAFYHMNKISPQLELKKTANL